MRHRRNREDLLTCGLDIGTQSVKIALLSHEGTGISALAKLIEPVLGRRDPRDIRVAIRQAWARAQTEAGVSANDIHLVASTGTRERRILRVGHFYRRSSHSIGAHWMFPEAAAVLDVGAKQVRCAALGEVGAGVRYRCVAQGAAGAELLDALARRAGVARALVSELPEAYAVVDEMAARALRVLESLAIDGKVALTGGMALDEGFVCALLRHMLEAQTPATLLISPDAVHAGALGAALLAAKRYRRAMPEEPAPARPAAATVPPWALN